MKKVVKKATVVKTDKKPAGKVSKKDAFMEMIKAKKKK